MTDFLLLKNEGNPFFAKVPQKAVKTFLKGKAKTWIVFDETRVKDIAKEKGVSTSVVCLGYFFDCFLRRLPTSSCVDKFVL